MHDLYLGGLATNFAIKIICNMPEVSGGGNMTQTGVGCINNQSDDMLMLLLLLMMLNPDTMDADNDFMLIILLVMLTGGGKF